MSTEPDAPTPADQHNEQDRERAGAAGDDLARAVDRHRDELGMPAEPADGEDATGEDTTGAHTSD